MNATVELPEGTLVFATQADYRRYKRRLLEDSTYIDREPHFYPCYAIVAHVEAADNWARQYLVYLRPVAKSAKKTKA